MGYSCIGLCRSWRSVACCGSSVVFPVSLVAAVRGSVWRFKPFCCVWRSGIPLKRFGAVYGHSVTVGKVFSIRWR